MLWDDPSSYTDEPVQVFLMYYLIDTDRENGCLRVIPGSPRRRQRLHGLPPAHGKEIATVGGDRPVLQPDPDEVDVPVRAGDLAIGDPPPSLGPPEPLGSAPHRRHPLVFADVPGPPRAFPGVLWKAQ